MPVLILLGLVATACTSVIPRQQISGLEKREFEIRVASYTSRALVMDAMDGHSEHYDMLAFEILRPEQFAGRRWHFYISNQAVGPLIDYGFRAGDVLWMNGADLGLTTKEIEEMIQSRESLNTVFVPHQFLRKANQAVEPTAASGRGSP